MALNPAERALACLAGLSVGDAFGNQFFPLTNRGLDPLTETPPGQWGWSDDTEMACSVVDALIHDGHIDQEGLAADFADRMDIGRRYGVGTLELLEKVRDGVHWRMAASAGFGERGSYGNGAAMRVAPLGAFYAGAPGAAATEAAVSAEVTHTHAEGIAGAVAIAVAASHVAGPGPHKLFEVVLDHLTHGPVRQGLDRAWKLRASSAQEAAAQLGNGSRITAEDTVPFTLWVAARHLNDYETAVRTCVAVGGDMDTTAAIVGGIIAAHIPSSPKIWLRYREPLPAWFGNDA